MRVVKMCEVFVEILHQFSFWTVAILSTCNVIRAGGWNIQVTDLPYYDRNPLPPSNWEAVEASSPLLVMRCLLFRKSKYELQGHINTSKRSRKQSVLTEWLYPEKNTADGHFQGMNSYHCIYHHLTICCFVVNAA